MQPMPTAVLLERSLRKIHKMHSSAVAIALEVEVEVQDAALKGGLEAFLVAIFPLLVEDLESDVLVGRPRMEYEQARAAMLVRIRILLPKCIIRIRHTPAHISENDI